jgi:hypothetical protein
MDSTSPSARPVDSGSTKPTDQNVVYPPPVIIDLGTKSRKAIRNLKNGTGQIRNQVEEAIEQIRLRLPDADKNKQIIPIVLIYRQRRRRTALSFPFPPLNLFR